MSYLIDGVNDNLRAVLVSGPNANGSYNSFPLTIACWIKVSGFVANSGTIAQFGVGLALNDSFRLHNDGTTDNTYNFRVRTSAGTESVVEDTISATEIDDVWMPVICTVTDDDNRAIYPGTGFDSLTAARAVTDTVRYLVLGENLTGSQPWAGYIAEVAIWKSALDGTARTAYLGGTSADQIDSPNLLVYWSLASDNTQTAGTDSVGSLTVDGATYDADHPTITGAAIKYLKLLAESSAASETGLEVVVYSAPSGSNYVTGTTRYGSTNGQAFEATLEAGEAVLLVPAADVGCSELAASTTVAALVQNTTYTTGMVAATIVEV